MKTVFERRKAAWTAVGVSAAFAFGCTAAVNPGFLRDAKEQECAAMDIKPQPIRIDHNTRRVKLGETNKNLLIIPTGAVTQGIVLNFQVDTIVVNGKRGAGVAILPDPSNPAFEFEEPIELRLSYDDCGEFKGEENTRHFIILKTSMGVTISIGGAKIKKHDFVSVLIDSFSKFAIAIN